MRAEEKDQVAVLCSTTMREDMASEDLEVLWREQENELCLSV